jgi:hypothetical protein
VHNLAPGCHDEKAVGDQEFGGQERQVRKSLAADSRGNRRSEQRHFMRFCQAILSLAERHSHLLVRINGPYKVSIILDKCQSFSLVLIRGFPRESAASSSFSVQGNVFQDFNH